MKFRILALFVAIQIASFALWQHTNAAPNFAVPALPSASNIHFSAWDKGSGRATMDEPKLQGLITSILSHLPKSHTEAVKSVILDYDPAAGRGLGGKQMIILRATMEPMELGGVLIHEVGHDVDLVALHAQNSQQPSGFKDGDHAIYVGDPSLDFYRISWSDEKTLGRTAGNLDFVSGYAMQDPFEDFAETYAYYVLHNQDFKAKVASSSSLYAKYRFMKFRVFDGKEFDAGPRLSKPTDLLARPWDVTVLPYEMEKVLN